MKCLQWTQYLWAKGKRETDLSRLKKDIRTREYGSRVRFGMISIDADIEPDGPVDLNIQAYCNDCRVCIKACPGRAISETKVWWRGVYKHKINDTKCYPHFKKYHGCGICLKVCPINRFGYETCMTVWRNYGVI